MKDTFTDSPEFRAVARFYGERRAALAKDAEVKKLDALRLAAERFYGERRAALAKDAEVKKLDALRLAAERAAANGGSW